MIVTDQLKGVELKYAEIEARLAANETYSDPDLVSRLNREQRELEPLVTAYRSLCAAKEDLLTAEELLSDHEMKDFAQEEFQQAKNRIEHLEQQIRILLLPKTLMTVKT